MEDGWINKWIDVLADKKTFILLLINTGSKYLVYHTRSLYVLVFAMVTRSSVRQLPLLGELHQIVQNGMKFLNLMFQSLTYLVVLNYALLFTNNDNKEEKAKR